MKLSNLAYWTVPLALICGCQTVVELRQPANIPVFVDEYGKPLLVQKTHAVPCMLNLVNCPEKATLVIRKLSGSTKPDPAFPIRAVVGGEFLPLAKANFRPVVAAEQAKVELKVETRKVILERDGDDLTFNLSLAVKLLNPRHEDKPYFSKVYEASTMGTMMNEELVPNCVYEAVQQIAQDFISEVNADESLVVRLSEIQL